MKKNNLKQIGTMKYFDCSIQNDVAHIKTPKDLDGHMLGELDTIIDKCIVGRIYFVLFNMEKSSTVVSLVIGRIIRHLRKLEKMRGYMVIFSSEVLKEKIDHQLKTLYDLPHDELTFTDFRKAQETLLEKMDKSNIN